MNAKTSETNTAEILSLITALQNGDDSAYPLLLDRYMPLLKKLAASYARDTASHGIDAEELLQEARWALYKAAKSYDVDQQKVTFGLYAKICVNRRLLSLKRKLNSKKEPKIITPTRKKALFFTDDFSGSDRGKILKEAEKQLSAFEKTVLRMHLSGMKYAEIAQELGKSVKSIDNALARAKKKLRIYASASGNDTGP